MPAIDNVGNGPEAVTPSDHFTAVTPHDTNELAEVSKALYVGGAGNLVVKGFQDSAAVTFVGVPAGAVLPLRVKLVMAAGTTATNIVSLA